MASAAAGLALLVDFVRERGVGTPTARVASGGAIRPDETGFGR